MWFFRLKYSDAQMHLDVMTKPHQKIPFSITEPTSNLDLSAYNTTNQALTSTSNASTTAQSYYNPYAVGASTYGSSLQSMGTTSTNPMSSLYSYGINGGVSTGAASLPGSYGVSGVTGVTGAYNPYMAYQTTPQSAGQSTGAGTGTGTVAGASQLQSTSNVNTLTSISSMTGSMTANMPNMTNMTNHVNVNTTLPSMANVSTSAQSSHLQNSNAASTGVVDPNSLAVNNNNVNGESLLQNSNLALTNLTNLSAEGSSSGIVQMPDVAKVTGE